MDPSHTPSPLPGRRAGPKASRLTHEDRAQILRRTLNEAAAWRDVAELIAHVVDLLRRGVIL
jgi:hypothetical protein